MAYPIKNSATLQTNSIKWGSFGIGVNQGGYGLTSSTSFWNGKTPNVSGYVLYIGNGASSPTTYVAKNDSDLITLSNTLGYGPNTTIGEALTAFNTSSGVVICINVDSPNIVTSGLTLYLDAGFTPSYPKVNIKWNDLCGVSAITGTLTNGPTFNTDFYGSIVFDGTNDYVSCGNILDYTSGDFSFSYWIYVTSLTTGTPGSGPVIIYKGGYQVNGYYDQLNADGSISFITNTAGGGAVTGTAAGIISVGNIYNIAYTRSGTSIKIYLNGVDVTGFSGTHANPVTSSNNFLIASYAVGIFANVRIYSFANYNRQLSAAEVLQNYYAGKKRFIPTNGLLLWLDGENTNTRVITPTTAIDVSNNDYNGNFINGASLKHFDAGTSFYFDGVDDYISINNSSIMPTGDYTKVIIFKLQSLGFSNNLMSGNNHFLYLAGGAFLRAGHFVSGQEAISSYTTVVNTWNFAVVTFNSTNGFRIYQNGNTVVGSTSAATASAGGNVLLGSVLSGGSFLLQGQIGISMLYNRVLTTDEILTIYTAYKGRFGYA